MADLRRRRLLIGLSGLALPAIAGVRDLLSPTPPQTPGPFYPVELPLDDDNDLTRVQGRSATARGRITDLTGRLLDRNGTPLKGVRIEIWQCDANGRYRHPWDRGEREPDPDFQGHGHTHSDATGHYRFRTIHPVPYPGRTPHIHVAVFPPGAEPFTTQLYVANEPRNANDGLYRRIPLEQRPLVTAEFAAGGGAGAELAAAFDIVLGVSPVA